MDSYNQFLQHFMKDHVSFFTRPLPPQEEIYNVEYTAARMDWKALKKDITKYRISKDTLEQLNQLFELAKTFTFALKTSKSNYLSARSTLSEKWKEIQNLALGIKL